MVVGLLVLAGCTSGPSNGAAPSVPATSPSAIDTLAPSAGSGTPQRGQLAWRTTTWISLEGSENVAVAADGWSYALESRGHRITAFDSSGYRKQSFGEKGTGPGQFDFYLGEDQYQVVGGIAVSGDNVYVADESGRIQRFDREGKFLGAWGTRGGDRGQFQQPQRMVADSRGQLWVADAKQNSVQGFTPEGRLVTRIQVDVRENLKSICVDDEGFIYVADEIGTIYKYATTGKRVAQFGTPSNDDGTYDDGELTPALKGMACETGDSIYVNDADAQISGVPGVVHVFTKTGKFVDSFPGGNGGIALAPDATLIGTNVDLGTLSKWHLG